jgi:ADP-ribosyl-[dinitrogen reductase] hydrolase
MRGAALVSSQANGSLMRQSPLGIFGWRMDAGELADLACRDSALTHPNPACQEACVACAHAIATAIRTGPSARAIYDETITFMRARQGGAFAGHRSSTARSGEPAASSGVLAALERAADEPPAEFHRQQGWVLIALQNAFHRLLHAPSLEAGIVETVACGGDTDTNACIAGALLGAVHGEAAVPKRWINVLLACRSPRPRDYTCPDLLKLADALSTPASA